MRSYRDPERAASFTVRFLWAQRIFVLIESAIARCHTTVHARCCNLSGTLPNQLAWMRARCVATIEHKMWCSRPRIASRGGAFTRGRAVYVTHGAKPAAESAGMPSTRI